LHLVETSAAARNAHCSILDSHASRLASSSTRLPDEIHGIIYANELLDALPVHALVGTHDGICERYVALDDRAPTSAPRFVEQVGPLSNDTIGRHLSSLGVILEPGWKAEVNLSALAWLTRACSALHQGFLVLIDYGHPSDALYSESHAAGTLTAFAQHTSPLDGPDGEVPGWLKDPGSRDITSHVDLTSIRRVAEALGCETLGIIDQTYFLMALADLEGSDGRGLGSDPRTLRAFKTLVMPGGLGSTMKVMVFGRNVGRPTLAGLTGPSRLT
jgi:SAM-dependent MidA family methyltransferase